ncbi:hypothetical protein QTP88_001582 [Uroleucon formosanum]
MSLARRSNKNKGSGLINTLINKLPFELHVPGYQYCGPGTNLKKRLARGDKGINLLDSACREHDIAYEQSNSITDRNKADYILEQRAWDRFKSKDSSLKEKAVAWGVTTAMKAKRKSGDNDRELSQSLNLFKCNAFYHSRATACTYLGVEELNAENLVEIMLLTKDNWQSVSTQVGKIMVTREAEERARQRAAAMEDEA